MLNALRVVSTKSFLRNRACSSTSFFRLCAYGVSAKRARGIKAHEMRDTPSSCIAVPVAFASQYSV